MPVLASHISQILCSGQTSGLPLVFFGCLSQLPLAVHCPKQADTVSRVGHLGIVRQHWQEGKGGLLPSLLPIRKQRAPGSGHRDFWELQEPVGQVGAFFPGRGKVFSSTCARLDRSVMWPWHQRDAQNYILRWLPDVGACRLFYPYCKVSLALSLKGYSTSALFTHSMQQAAYSEYTLIHYYLYVTFNKHRVHMICALHFPGFSNEHTEVIHTNACTELCLYVTNGYP